MNARQRRVRAVVRFVFLTAALCVWLFLAHAIPAAAVAVMGL